MVVTFFLIFRVSGTLDAFSGPCQTYVMTLLRGNINYFLAVNVFLQKAQI